jgi:type I restriction enzyme M protein
MLTEALSYLRERHSPAPLHVFGQELNSQTFAIAASGMLMKQADDHTSDDDVRYGDTFLNDQFSGKTFDYLISHPPFGLNWKKQKKDIQREHETDGFAGRFGAGLPRISDASLLFLQHMIDKFKPASPDEHSRGSRLAIVFSGSPMFAGAAGSGESQIRKWIIENDWLEAVIALPEHIFYNTDIGTYVWIVTNRKEHHRRGCIQLIDARKQYVALRRSLSPRRRKIGEMEDGRDQITEIVRLYRDFAEEKNSRRLKNASFGYTHVTIERPLRLRYQMTTRDKARFLDAYPELLDDVQTIDATIGREPVRDWNNVWNAVLDVLHNRKTTWTVDQQKLFRSVFTERDANAEPVANTRRADDYEADPELRTVENVPLTTDVDTYFEQEVLPHVPDAWMDRTKDKIGYEINFNRYFYRRAPSRALADINADLKKVEEDIVRLLREVTE